MKLSKLSIPYRAVKTSGSVLAVFAFTSFEASKLSPLFFLGGLIIFVLGLVLTGIWFYLVWKNFSFEVTEDTFDIKSGVINKKQREIPLHRIQNVDVKRNIFQRILGIAKVNLETAGGKTSEASLMFVDFDKSKDIQKKVRELKEEHKIEEAEDEKPMFSLSNKELGILSITSIDFRVLSILFVGLSFLSIGSLVESAPIGLVALLGLILFVVILVALVGSAASNINKYYGFKLYRRGDSLEYERGLLNRSEGSIPFEKIQNLRIEENPLKRLVGYATLKVETAGYSGQDQSQQEPEVAVPLARKDHVVDLSNKIFDHGTYNIQGVSRNAFRRYFGRYSIVLLSFTVVSVTAISTISETRPLFELIAFIPPLAGITAYFKYINKGFYEGEKYFYTMNGFWNRKTTITPYYRIQNLSLSQTIFQKRLSTSTLILDTAGIYTFASNPKAVDLDEGIGKNLFGQVYSSFKKSSKN